MFTYLLYCLQSLLENVTDIPEDVPVAVLLNKIDRIEAQGEEHLVDKLALKMLRTGKVLSVKKSTANVNSKQYINEIHIKKIPGTKHSIFSIYLSTQITCKDGDSELFRRFFACY